MPTVEDSGSPTLVISTPNTVFTTANNKHYSVNVNLTNLASGDTIKITFRKKTLSGGSLAKVDEWTRSDAQANPSFEIPYIPCPYGCDVILEQTAGTGRSFEWHVTSP